MTDSTARLSLREAFEAANDELALSEESGETDISSSEAEEGTQQEQLAVETSDGESLFSSLADDDNGPGDQPQGESYEVTVNGEKLLVELDELRSGYMRQADYTRKTQELSEQMQEAENAIALRRMLEERPQETLRKLYQRINAGKSLDDVGVSNPQVVQEEKTPDIEALVEARVQEALNNDPRIVQFQQEQALARINGIFGKIEDDYGVKLTDDDKNTVLVKAQDMGTTDLESVFGSLYAKKLKADRQRELEKRNAKNVSPLKGEGRQDVFNPQKAEPKKYDSFKSALLEQLELQEQDGGIETVSAL